MDSPTRKIAHKDKWEICKLHSTSYKPSVGCSLCKKMINASVHENVVAIRLMMEKGTIDKQIVAKINDKLNDKLIEFTKHAELISGNLLKATQGENLYTCFTNINESFSDIMQVIKEMVLVKQELSNLL